MATSCKYRAVFVNAKCKNQYLICLSEIILIEGMLFNVNGRFQFAFANIRGKTSVIFINFAAMHKFKLLLSVLMIVPTVFVAAITLPDTMAVAKVGNDSLLAGFQPDTVLNRLPDTLRFSNDSIVTVYPDTLLPILSDDSLPKAVVAARPQVFRPPARIVEDSMLVEYFGRHFDSLFLGAVHVHDTLQININDFDALAKGDLMYASLSNTGLAHQPLVYRHNYYNGFDMERHAFRKFIKTDADIRFLMPHKPFTDIHYMMGSKKEQHLNLSFARGIAPRTYLGLEFFLVNSPGPYRRSKSDNTGVYMTARHQTKGYRYGVNAYYLYNKIVVQENGGLADESQFSQNTETDRRNIRINLPNAENQVKHTGFGLEQYVNLSRHGGVDLGLSENDLRINLGRITHRMSYGRNQMLYRDGAPFENFYADFGPVFDSTGTHDSVYQHVFRNRLQWNTLGYEAFDGNVPFYLYGGIEHVASKLEYHPSFDTLGTYNRGTQYQFAPFAGIRIGLFRSSYLDGRFRVVTSGESAGDLRIEANWRQYLGTIERNIGSLLFGLDIINQSPSWFFERYHSNYFRWENDFRNSRYVTVSGAYHLKFFRAGFNMHVLDRHIYLNDKVEPVQHDGTFTMLHLFSSIDYTMGKFGFKGSFHYQLPDQADIVRVPDFSGKLKVVFTQVLVKDAATMQPGVSISYNTPYYADAYMPALRSFYHQDQQQLGGYPYVDLFLGLKVKRANLFVKATNLFALAGNYDYIMVPGYPMRDTYFYFGLSWRFYQ